MEVTICHINNYFVYCGISMLYLSLLEHLIISHISVNNEYKFICRYTNMVAKVDIMHIIYDRLQYPR